MKAMTRTTDSRIPKTNSTTTLKNMLYVSLAISCATNAKNLTLVGYETAAKQMTTLDSSSQRSLFAENAHLLCLQV